MNSCQGTHKWVCVCAIRGGIDVMWIVAVTHFSCVLGLDLYLFSCPLLIPKPFLIVPAPLDLMRVVFRFSWDGFPLLLFWWLGPSDDLHSWSFTCLSVWWKKTLGTRVSWPTSCLVHGRSLLLYAFCSPVFCYDLRFFLYSILYMMYDILCKIYEITYYYHMYDLWYMIYDVLHMIIEYV